MRHGVNFYTSFCRKEGESLYDILGVDKDATPDQIRKAYRKVCSDILWLCEYILNDKSVPLIEVIQMYMCS